MTTSKRKNRRILRKRMRRILNSVHEWTRLGRGIARARWGDGPSKQHFGKNED